MKCNDIFIGRQQQPIKGINEEFKGSFGEKGYKGDFGFDGEPGDPGIVILRPGFKGEKGLEGDRGDFGAKGVTGRKGIEGVAGPKGEYLEQFSHEKFSFMKMQGFYILCFPLL